MTPYMIAKPRPLGCRGDFGNRGGVAPPGKNGSSQALLPKGLERRYEYTCAITRNEFSLSVKPKERDEGLKALVHSVFFNISSHALTTIAGASELKYLS